MHSNPARCSSAGFFLFSCERSAMSYQLSAISNELSAVSQAFRYKLFLVPKNLLFSTTTYNSHPLVFIRIEGLKDKWDFCAHKQPRTFNPQPKTHNSQPSTQNSQLKTQNSQPSTHNYFHYF